MRLSYIRCSCPLLDILEFLRIFVAFNNHNTMQRLLLYTILTLLFYNSSLAQKADSLTFDSKELNKLELLRDSFEIKGEYQTALAYAEQIVTILKKNSQKDTSYVKGIQELAFLYQKLNNYEKALTLLTEQKNILKKIYGPTHSTYATTLAAIAKVHIHDHNYDKATQLLLEAKKIQLDSLGQDHPDYAETLNTLASTYSKVADYEQAEILLIESNNIQAKHLKDQNDRLQYANGLNSLGVLYWRMGHYEQTEPLFIQAKDIWKKELGEKHPNYGSGLNNLALLYSKMNKYEEALPLLEESKLIWEEKLGKTHRLYTQCLSNLAVVLVKLEEYEEAEPLFTESLEIQAATLSKTHPTYAQSLNNLASLYAKQIKHDQNITLLTEAISIWKNTYGDEHYTYTKGLSNLANAYLAKGQIIEALDYVKLSITANCPALANDLKFSKAFLEELPKHDYHSHANILASLKVLYNILREQYKRTKSINTLHNCYLTSKVAMQLLEKFRIEFSLEGDKTGLLSKNTFFVDNAINTALELYKLDTKLNYTPETFYFVEQIKYGLIADALQAQRARNFGNLPDSVVSQEQNLQKQLSQLKKKILDTRVDSIKNTLRQQLGQLNQDITLFQKKLKLEYPKYYRTKHISTTITSQKAQSLLDKNTAIIEYYVSDTTTYIFYIDQTNTLVYPLAIKRNHLRLQIKKLRQALSDYQFIRSHNDLAYKQFHISASWFYQKLLAPVLDQQKGINRLIIVPDDQLGHLPFEAFLVEPSQSTIPNYGELHYLIKDYKISYNYSSTLLQENTINTRKQVNGKILAMAANYNPKADHSSTGKIWGPYYQNLRRHLEPLPATGGEINDLSSLLFGKFILNQQASEQTFKEFAPQHGIIHLAMHGILNHRSPILSSLAFSETGDSTEDDFLQAHEISNMELHAALVTLSACETGYGIFQEGEGIMSLARSFMYAGIPALVVSLWQVNDQSTSIIMQNFYENLCNEMTKDEALRQAKLSFMANATGWAAHPAFWAPFIQQGDSGSIKIFKKGGTWWGPVSGVVILLISIIIYITSRRHAQALKEKVAQQKAKQQDNV